MGWFTRKQIDEELLEWEAQHWAWLIQNLKDFHDLKRLRLIEPTPKDFPITSGNPEERALAAFHCVQQHFGLEEWPCKLVAFEEEDNLLRRSTPVLARPETSNGAAGLFEINQKHEVVIHYKLEQVGDPIVLIATMAHELCHYVLATIADDPPCGWDEHEPLTDLTAVFFGFGIFQANSSFRFTQWQDHQHQGWSASRLGYLSENALALALALFCAWTDTPAELATKHLSINPKHYFVRYYKELLKYHEAKIVKLKKLIESADVG